MSRPDHLTNLQSDHNRQKKNNRTLPSLSQRIPFLYLSLLQETLLEAEPLGAVAMEEDLPTSHKRSPAPEGEPAAGNGPGSSNKGDPGQAIAPAGKNDGPGPGAASNPSQSRIYAEALQSLRDSIAFEETADCVPSWDAFPNHLGEGVRARLLSLATLHLSSGDVAAAVPAAVKQLPSNSNKVLFGAPTNCDLYQVRIIRYNITFE